MADGDLIGLLLHNMYYKEKKKPFATIKIKKERKNMYVGTPAPQNRGTELDKLTTQQPWDQIGLFPAEANRTQTSPAAF